MNFLESIKVSLSAISTNKLRSILTMLGIIIGISSVITVVTLGEGSKNAIGKEFENFGLGRAYIGTDMRESILKKDKIKTSDVELIRKVYEGKLLAVIPRVTKNAKIKMTKESIDVVLTGANENYQNIDNIEMVKGRYVSSSDVKSKRLSAVIDEKIANKVFKTKDILGKTIDVNMGYRTLTVTVVGVFKKPKSNLEGLQDGDDTCKVYVPITSLEKVVGQDNVYDGIDLNVDNSENVNDVTAKIVKLLERRHGNKDKKLYKVYTAEQEMSSINKVTDIVRVVLSIIAAVSLVVGGIGVMNIMLVSVTERTREIGIRKAIGARRKDILTQFLVETLIISGIGGIVGTILGVGISFIISKVIKIPITISLSVIFIAFIFSGGIGILSGIYPANKASKLDPIDALRYE